MSCVWETCICFALSEMLVYDHEMNADCAPNLRF